MANKILRLRSVKDRTGLSTTDIYAGMTAGTFPTSVPIGRRTVGWVDTEVDAWIAARIAARDAGTATRNPPGPGRGRKGSIGLRDTAAATAARSSEAA